MSTIRTNFIEPFLVIRQSVAPLKLSRWQFTKLLLKTFVGGLSKGAMIVLAALSLMLIIYLFSSPEKGRVRLPRELPVVKANDSHFENILKEARLKVRGDFPALCVQARASN